MSTLASELASQVKSLYYKGYEQYDARDYRLALRTFYQAWLVLPKPQTHWREAGWVLTAIGDTYFRLGQYTHACEALRSALICPEAKRSAFIRLRLGQSLLELGDQGEAQLLFNQAYELGGERAFAGEPAKYRRLVAGVRAQTSPA